MARRLVVLQGRFQVSQWVDPNIFNIEGDIRTVLTNKGFDVVSVKTGYLDYIGYDEYLTLELLVDNAYTAEQVRQSAIRELEGARRSIGVTTIQTFYDVNLAVASDARGNVPSNTVVTHNGQLPTWQQPRNTDFGAVGDAAKDALDKVAWGAGLTIPLVALGLIGYLIITRR